MRKITSTLSVTLAAALLLGCQPPAPNTNVAQTNVSNSTANVSNLNTNTNSSGTSITEAREPDRYRADVKLSLEALGEKQNAPFPPLTAIVARNGGDRRMEFTLPTGDKVIYLDTAAGNFIVLPGRRQYAEIDRQTMGFEVRRMMMPEQIVDQVTRMQGIQRLGEEEVNGRKAIKYGYAATAETQSRAGQIGTDSYFLIDQQTGLPLRSETVSQAQSGANVQGYKGLKVVTEMSNISTEPDPELFVVPSEFAKVDTEQVKAQATLIFNAMATIISNAVQQQTNQPASSPAVK